ncbi:MAG: mevalonate kinase [Promethearchaeota archaeon]
MQLTNRNENRYVEVRVPGKCILFGEHAVVYGYPGIAIAINIFSHCKITKQNNDTNKKNKSIRIELKNYNKELVFQEENLIHEGNTSEFQQFTKGFQLFQSEFDLDLSGLSITISSDLWPSAGLGSSASVALAFCAAISNFYKLNLTKNQLSQYAFQMEQVVHGSPSGIDNNVCTFGGILYYKDRILTHIGDLGLFKSFPSLLVVNSGKIHNTKSAIQKISNLKDQNPEKIKKIFQKIGKISEQGFIGLEKHDWEKIGHLMDQNQQLLVELGLSTPEIDEILKIAKLYPIYGAKLTGAGAGGCVIILAHKEILINLKIELESKGFPSIITMINH